MGFIFKPELVNLIVKGRKTQTRRPMNGKRLENGIVYTATGRKHHQVGKDYAVVYGRGKPSVWWNPKTKLVEPYAVYAAGIHQNGKDKELQNLRNRGYEPLRIRILDIFCEDVRSISYPDVRAEGFVDGLDFLAVWRDFYDPTGVKQKQDIMSRPAELYQGFAYKFEIV